MEQEAERQGCRAEALLNAGDLQVTGNKVGFLPNKTTFFSYNVV